MSRIYIGTRHNVFKRFMIKHIASWQRNRRLWGREFSCGKRNALHIDTRIYIYACIAGKIYRIIGFEVDGFEVGDLMTMGQQREMEKTRIGRGLSFRLSLAPSLSIFPLQFLLQTWITQDNRDIQGKTSQKADYKINHTIMIITVKWGEKRHEDNARE